MKILLCAALIAAQGSGARVDRPAAQIFEDSKLDLVGSLQRRLSRYANPVICPVALCNGSCAAYDDACLLRQPLLSVLGVSLTGGAGCGGGCTAESSDAAQQSPEDDCCQR